MGQFLVGQCVYVDQELSFIGVVSARVNAIYIAGKKVRDMVLRLCANTPFLHVDAKMRARSLHYMITCNACSLATCTMQNASHELFFSFC